jgi:hypothetical protein
MVVLQVVMTSIEPKGSRRGAGYDAYEYIAHSHTYMSDSQPTAKITYDLSPIQVCVHGYNHGSFGVDQQDLQQRKKVQSTSPPLASSINTSSCAAVRQLITIHAPAGMPTCWAGLCDMPAGVDAA